MNGEIAVKTIAYAIVDYVRLPSDPEKATGKPVDHKGKNYL